MIGGALKVTEFIKRNTTLLFSSTSCLRVAYFSLVRSILEYGVVVWHPHLTRKSYKWNESKTDFLSY